MLLFTFLKAVKKKSPSLFWSFLTIIFFQLTCTFLKIEVTPFLLYGMYSEKMPVQNEFFTGEVEVNDTQFITSRLSNWHADILFTGYENYSNMLHNSQTDIVKTRVEEKYHFLTQSFLYPFLQEKIYNTEPDLNNFIGWYRSKFAQFSKVDVKMIRIFSIQVKFDPATFTFTKQPRKLIATF